MRNKYCSVLLGLIGMFGGLVAAPGCVGPDGAGGHWVASWTASPSDAATATDAAGLAVPVETKDQTFRMVVTPHLGGGSLRIRLSNRFGTAPATFGRVTVAHAGQASAQRVTPVTFNGRSQVVAPPGQDVASDPVRFRVSAFEPLAISIHLPGTQGMPTKHWNANATSMYAPPSSGDLTGVADNSAFPLRTQAWFHVNGVDVSATRSTHAVVAFGDSITDGFVAASTASLPVDTAVADKNGRYPDNLQRRVNAARLPISVVNAGLGANRLLTDGFGQFPGPSGLHRLQADALDQPGACGVLLLEGINDLGIPPATTTADQLIAGYQQAISAAHAAGKKIWLGTMMPASNPLPNAPNREMYRQQANTWIRTQQLADGIVDFDAALRSPSDPKVLNPAYAGPDNLHPNLAGYQAMANTVDLTTLNC